MEPNFRLYIQQITYDGDSFTNIGNAVDTFDEWGIACQSFPFKVLPEPKDYVTRDWLDEDGLDVYVPRQVKFKKYDLEAEFIFAGNTSNMRQNLKSFIRFLYGKNAQNGSPLLSIYDEYTGIGRRNVLVTGFDTTQFLHDDTDEDSVATFKVKFSVHDPVTDIVKSVNQQTGNVTLIADS